MNTKNRDKIIYKTCTHLQSGGVILYPTDTVWGIGCDATNEAAIKKIYSLKKRSKEKGLILLMSSKEMLDHYINDIPSIASEILKNNNEPTTIIYKNPINLPKLLIHQNSIAVRLVGKCFIHELIKKFNKPITSTSANISGDETPKKFNDISSNIKKNMDYIVPEIESNIDSNKKPSKIIKLIDNFNFEIIRN